jgi:ubiquinone/menaquinone biosynthesis C-methylase UbiE
MPERDPKKFDPARAHLLDAPERERYLPTAKLVELLALDGGETVVDYGAGTGRAAVALAAALPRGRVIAVDENDEMLEHLRGRLDGLANASAVRIAGNRLDMDPGGADRVLAVNLLHEVRGERALAEMRRLVSPDGFVLVVDWERGRERATGPPDELLYSIEEAALELADSAFSVESVDAGLPYHFALIARPKEAP